MKAIYRVAIILLFLFLDVNRTYKIWNDVRNSDSSLEKCVWNLEKVNKVSYVSHKAIRITEMNMLKEQVESRLLEWREAAMADLKHRDYWWRSKRDKQQTKDWCAQHSNWNKNSLDPIVEISSISSNIKSWLKVYEVLQSNFVLFHYKFWLFMLSKRCFSYLVL